MKKKKKKNKKKKKKKLEEEEEEEEEIEDKEKDVEAIISEVRNLLDDDIDAEEDDDIDAEEDDFWMPPVGDRWDFDDGGDRWDSGSESGQESDEVNETGMFCFYFKLKLCYFVIDESFTNFVKDGPSPKLI